MPKNQPDTWPVRKLKPHPRQAATFPDLAEPDLAALAADMAANGLQHPVAILPNGVILGGHQRVRAAKRLGWKTIDVVVRHDLAAAGVAAATAYFITDNLNRRQLSPLAKARCVGDLYELAVGRRTAEMDGDDRDGLKAMVAERLGMSVRNVNRYLLALTAPPAVQAAFERGHLTLTEVGKVAGLGRRAAAVGEAVAAVYAAHPDGGGEVRRLVQAAARGTAEAADPDVTASLCRLVRAVRREMPAVRHGQCGVDRGMLARVRPVLADAHSLFAALLKRAEDVKA